MRNAPREPREVIITITISGRTDRDPWEWGEAIARNLRAEFADDGSELRQWRSNASTQKRQAAEAARQ